jgi:hypothetical protein
MEKGFLQAEQIRGRPDLKAAVQRSIDRRLREKRVFPQKRSCLCDQVRSLQGEKFDGQRRTPVGSGLRRAQPYCRSRPRQIIPQ